MSVSRFEQVGGLTQFTLPPEGNLTIGHLEGVMSLTLAPELSVDSRVAIFPNRTIHSGKLASYGIRRIAKGARLPDYTDPTDLRGMWTDEELGIRTEEIVYVVPGEEVEISSSSLPELTLSPLAKRSSISFAVTNHAIMLGYNQSSGDTLVTLTDVDSDKIPIEPEMTDDMRATLYHSLRTLYAFSENGYIEDESSSMTVACKEGRVQCLIMRSDKYPELMTDRNYRSREFVIEPRSFDIRVTDYGPTRNDLPKARRVASPGVVEVALLLALADDIRKTM